MESPLVTSLNYKLSPQIKITNGGAKEGFMK